MAPSGTRAMISVLSLTMHISALLHDRNGASEDLCIVLRYYVVVATAHTGGIEYTTMRVLPKTGEVKSHTKLQQASAVVQ